MTGRGGVVVVGSSNADLVARVSHAPAGGETVLCDSYETLPGGKGANQAVAAARMGSSVSLVACLGSDGLGRTMLEGFVRDGIDTTHVHSISGGPTGTAFIWVEPGGENRIVVASGANARLTPDLVEGASGIIRRAAVVLCQLETPLRSVRRALELARMAGVTTILNPAPAQTLDDEMIGMVDILTPNEGEAAGMLGLSPNRHEDLAAGLLSLGAGAVCLTLGEEGVLVLERGGCPVRIPAPAVAISDTTAAGDTFNGALAAELARGLSLVDAARIAVIAASLCCTRPGAQPSIPTFGEVRAFKGG